MRVKYDNVVGGQGGKVNDPWDGKTKTLCLVSRGWKNHLSLLWVCSVWLSGFVKAWRTGSLCALGRYALHLGL